MLENVLTKHMKLHFSDCKYPVLNQQRFRAPDVEPLRRFKNQLFQRDGSLINAEHLFFRNFKPGCYRNN